MPKERFALPSRPLNLKEEELTQVAQSREEFKYVEKILPSEIVPEPPVHESYPTPSGWMPPNYEKSSKLPYYVLRTRFHNFPIYLVEREGGSRKLVRIKNIHGNIWVTNSKKISFKNFILIFFLKQFDADLRKFIQESLEKYEDKKLSIYSQVNEVQRQVLVKGHYHEYISKFFIECGF